MIAWLPSDYILLQQKGVLSELDTVLLNECANALLTELLTLVPKYEIDELDQRLTDFVTEFGGSAEKQLLHEVIISAPSNDYHQGNAFGDLSRDEINERLSKTCESLTKIIESSAMKQGAKLKM